MMRNIGSLIEWKNASINGNINRVRELLELSSYPKKRYPVKLEESPLMLAAKFGHSEIIKLFLDHGVSANEENIDGLSALHYAARGGYVFCVKYLIERGANLEQVAFRFDGRTPLLSAIWGGYPSVVKMLLKSGADPNYKGEYWRTPQQLAAALGKLKIYKMFKLGMPGTVRSVILAAQGGHLKIIQYFVEKNGNVNQTDNCETPLHGAARNGKNEIIQYLLMNGADTMIGNSEWKSPLHYAAQHGQTKSFLLLANWVIENLRNHSQICWEVLVLQSIKSDNITHYHAVLYWYNTLKTLSIVKETEYSPLHASATYNSVSIVRLLLATGEDVNVKNNSGSTPLEIAICAGSDRVARVLLENNAVLNGIEHKKKLALLLISVWTNVPSVIRYLTSIGANINMWCWERKNLLHHACEFGFGEVAAELIKAGIDINCRDLNGITPLDEALSNNFIDLSLFLQRQGAAKGNEDVHLKKRNSSKFGNRVLINAAKRECKIPEYLLNCYPGLVKMLSFVRIGNQLDIDMEICNICRKANVEERKLNVIPHNLGMKCNLVATPGASFGYDNEENLLVKPKNVKLEPSNEIPNASGVRKIETKTLAVRPYMRQMDSNVVTTSDAIFGNVGRMQSSVIPDNSRSFRSNFSYENAQEFNLPVNTHAMQPELSAAIGHDETGMQCYENVLKLLSLRLQSNDV
ncbi:hypothetical protein C0J52_19206 [Blattella germanica]|nr:hypothetical protein C0J52_19206 [Blattella germanica]